MARTGRRSKLTDAVVDEVVKAVAVGAPQKAAAQAAGISESAMYQYLQTGEAVQAARADAEREGRRYRPTAHEARCLDFLERLARAREEAHVRYAAQLAKYAREGDVRAVTFWLERRRPEFWGRRDRLDHTHHAGDDAPDLAQIVGDDPEVLDLIDALRERVAAAAAAQDDPAEQEDRR